MCYKKLNSITLESNIKITNKMAIEIKKSILAQQVQDGWKRKALAEHYGLPETQMAQVLRNAGLKIRKFHAPKYQLVDDTNSEELVEITNEGNDVVVGEDVNVLQEDTQQEVATPVTTEEPTAGW